MIGTEGVASRVRPVDAGRGCDSDEFDDGIEDTAASARKVAGELNEAGARETFNSRGGT